MGRWGQCGKGLKSAESLWMKGRIGKLNPYDVPRDERGSSLNPVRDSRTRLNHETLFFFIPRQPTPSFQAVSPASLMVLKFSRVKTAQIPGRWRTERWEGESEQLGQRDRITQPPLIQSLKGGAPVTGEVLLHALTVKEVSAAKSVSLQVLHGPTLWLYPKFVCGKGAGTD